MDVLYSLLEIQFFYLKGQIMYLRHSDFFHFSDFLPIFTYIVLFKYLCVKVFSSINKFFF